MAERVRDDAAETRHTAVSPDDLSDLLLAPVHSSVAFLHEGRLEAVPVRFEFRGGRYIAGFAPGQPRPELDAAVALLVDDGCYYTELRGVRVEGTAKAAEQSPGDGLFWLEVAPGRTIAWDYSALRPR
jgi:hypothetical protein